MAKLFKRAVHEPIRRFTDYESPQAHNDPAVVNQPALVAERVHIFVDHVLQQAMVDDGWSFGPLTGHLLEQWLLPHPKWQDEHQSYTRKTKDTICKAVMQALSDYQDHLTGADKDEDSLTKIATKLPPAEGEVLDAWAKAHIAAAEDDELADAIIAYVQQNFEWGAKPELRDRLLAILKKCPPTTKTLYRAEEPSHGTSPEGGQRGFRSWTVNHDTAVYLGNHMGPRNFAVRTTGGAAVKGLSINDFHYWHGRIHGYAGSGTPQAEYLVLDSTVPKKAWTTDVRYAKMANDKTKKKRNWRGLSINIEHPAGTTRKGVSPDGHKWEREMLFDYGHFKGVEGADGDGLDCYVGPNDDSDLAFVVNQLFEDGTFDEHKVMLGFRDQGTATQGYLAHMPPGWTRFDPVRPMTVAELRHWLGHEEKARKVAAPPRVSFEQWLEAVGGWRGFDSIFGHDWAEPYLEEAEQNDPGIEGSELLAAAREIAAQDMENRLRDWQYKYEAHLQFPLKLYRAVTLSDRNALNTEGIGIYWTDSESHAQAHWGHGHGGHVYVICAEITEDAIDWPNTIIANMHPSLGEDEQEIRLHPGARVRLVGFRKKPFGWGEVEPWKPLEAEAVA